MIALGVGGYYFASYLDFLGLQYITASLERLIFYIYPTLVVLITWIFMGRIINRPQLIALGLTYLGITIAFIENVRISGSSDFFKGSLLVLLCAFCFAIYLIGSGKLLPRIGTLRYTSIAMVAAGVGVTIHHAIAQQLQLFHFHTNVYWISFFIAIIATVLPSYMISESIRIIGASNAAIISSIGPIMTIFLAFMILEEELNFWQWVGTLLVIAGIMIISLQKTKKQPGEVANK